MYKSATGIQDIIIDDKELKLSESLYVEITKFDNPDEYIVSVPDYNEHGVGYSLEDAIVELKENLGELYLGLKANKKDAEEGLKHSENLLRHTLLTLV